MVNLKNWSFYYVAIMLLWSIEPKTDWNQRTKKIVVYCLGNRFALQ